MNSPLFRLHSKYSPMWDQPAAIDALISGLDSGFHDQTLLGVTGSGKTFTMANIIARTQRPALIIAHNKTLAAQLAQEFKEFFPDAAVHYFVSYYDYYQPEAFVVKTGAYIEKEATINEEIDRFRHAATQALITRRDVIIVSSVSCIYGIGDVEAYENQRADFMVGKSYPRDSMLSTLVSLQFKRSVADFDSGMFRVSGDTIEIAPKSMERVYVLEFFGDELERITEQDKLTREVFWEFREISVFWAKHFITPQATIDSVVPLIKAELEERVAQFQSMWKIVEAERLKAKTEYDIEMMVETGYVTGIENYSRYLTGRKAGEPPATLMDFFPEDYLTFIDESHITIPQIGAMSHGDRMRKENLVGYGFRLPSAYDNRPLNFEEFEKKIGQTLHVSATPADYEIKKSEAVIEQIIRPTGLLDPLMSVESMDTLVDSLLTHLRKVRERGERALITTLTKKSSEELAEFLAGNGYKVRYLHSDIETIERLEILKALRLGEIDVIVGVNLLREGLDLPEVSFIGIVDAEKIGFLRSTRSLLQIVGRAARNSNGYVVMYSHDGKLSSAMEETIRITEDRRERQMAYNSEHGITPTTVISTIKDMGFKSTKSEATSRANEVSKEWRAARMKRLEIEMDLAATNLDFERAAELRDELLALKRKS